MPVNLNVPLAWRTATGDRVADAQPAAAEHRQAHVRDHLQAVFLQFKDRAGARAFLKAVRGEMKSATAHLREVEAFRTSGTGADGRPIFLSMGRTRMAQQW